MDNIKSFEDVYESIKSKNQSDMQEIYLKTKSESKKRKIITLTTCLVADIIVLVIMYMTQNIDIIKMFPGNGLKNLLFGYSQFIPIIILDVFIYITMYFSYCKNRCEYNGKFKNLVIRDLLSYFFNNLDYTPDNGIKEDIYKGVGYFEHYDAYDSEDYINAMLGNKNAISMAEVVTTEEKTDTDSKGNTTTRTVVVFSGLFAKIKIDKSIKTVLKIEDNGSFFKSDRLKMDSQEFEKYFDVSCDDKIIGMQILTADVMEKLTQFYEVSNFKYDLIINGDLMYLRFHCGGMFEMGNLKDEIIPKETLQKYYNVLKFICDITKQVINAVNSVEI